MASGPPEGRNYDRNRSYIGIMCLTPGRYYLRMLDNQGDGICCNYGQGSFKISVNGKAVVESDDADYKQKDYGFVVRPQVLATTRPTPEPTRNPSPAPSIRPVQPLQTQDPAVAVSFIMMGDAPYYNDHKYCLNQQLRSLNPANLEHPYLFIIHVGDLKAGWTSCNSEKYSDVAQILSHESNQLHYDTRDIFLLLGDNDWNDCNNPNLALSYWMNNFGNGKKNNGRNTGPNPYGFGTLSDSNVARTLVHDDQGDDSNSATYPSSASNFAFFFNRVLFIGLNQVGGSSVGDESQRVANNFQWVKNNMAKYASRLKTVVVFTHADMDKARWSHFGRPFQNLLRVQYPDVFCLYAHGDSHSFGVNRVDKDNVNLIDLSCDSGEKAEPLLVTITRDTSGGRDGLVIDRRGGRYKGGDCDPGNREKTWGSEAW